MNTSSNIRLERLKNLYQHKEINVDVLRLDLLHPIISGNKWYKLKEYLKEARAQEKSTLLTFGGAYSNHIVATAAACREAGLQAVGVIRGEAAPILSHTLQMAQALGMKLFFTSREDYREKIIPQEVWNMYAQNETLVIGEGGYGRQGMLGAAGILKEMATTTYTDILLACGTGTTLAGIVHEASPHQKVTGISTLKNHQGLAPEINALLPEPKQNQFDLLHQYHFGGYAKHRPHLISFMNDWYERTGIPTDFVYTGKLFFALNDLVENDHFAKGSQLLIIHSGGLQGNLSLPKGTLIF